MQKKQRNNSLDCLRILVILFNVGTHSNFLAEYFPQFHYYVFQALTQGIIAIFLAISGYFYISGLLAGKRIFYKQFTAYLRCYLSWTAVYYLFSFIDFIVFGGKTWAEFLTQRVLYFFTSGSFYHLWYFVALIYAFLVATLVYRLWSKKGLMVFACVGVALHVVGAFGMCYYSVGKFIPGMGILYDAAAFPTIANIVFRGIPYFSSGLFICLVQPSFMRMKTGTAKRILAAVVVVFMLEAALLLWCFEIPTDRIRVALMHYPLGVAAVLAGLKFPMPAWSKVGEMFRNISTFVFCFHALPLSVFTIANERWNLGLNSVIIFALVLASCVVGYLLCAKMDNRFTRMLRGIG